MVARRNWSELPHELLEFIAEMLPTFEDYLSFVGVCRSWRSILVARLHYVFIQKSFPWLMLPQPEEMNENDEVEVEDDDKRRHIDLAARNFYSLPEDKVRHLDLPDAVDCYCWGSPYGWLVTCRKEKMNLLNPLSNVYVALPPLSSLQRYNSSHSVRKAVLTISPASNTSSATPLVQQFVAFVIFSGKKKMAFARPGDRAWKTIKSPASIYEDILHFNNQFYAVDIKGDVWQIDISTPGQVALHLACLPEKFYIEEGCRFYLVELLGELHMIARIFDLRSSGFYRPDEFRAFDQLHFARTSSFKVFKLDLRAKQWKRVHNLRKHAFFLGNNTSFSLFVSTPMLRCQWNAIYFTDDYDWESTLHIGEQYDKRIEKSIGVDMGIFNLYTKEIEPFYEEDETVTFMAPPLWITPNLC